MEIKEKCHNCHKPNLIDRPWCEDVFCGWCGTEYKMVHSTYLLMTEVRNNHLTAKQKEQRRLENEILAVK